MHRLTRAVLWIFGLAVSLVFLREMLGHFSRGASPYAGNWAHPSPLPTGLATTQRNPLIDSLTVALVPRGGGFDSVFVADITIGNLSASPISDIALRCDALSDDATTLGHAVATFHDTFAPHATKIETNVELHFIHRPTAARCVIVDVRSGP